MNEISTACVVDTGIKGCRYFGVTGHAKKRQCNTKLTEKMNRQANALTKSKELQPIPQTDKVAAHLFLFQRTLDINNLSS